MQTLLEQACYEFGKKRLPNVLKSSGWDCPESAELHRWARILQSTPDLFSSESVKSLGKPVEGLLQSAADLRHTAVHRLRVTVQTVELFIVDAEALAELMEAKECSVELAYLGQHVAGVVGDLELHKDNLELRLTVELADFAARRVELDMLEQAAVNDMVEADKRFQDVTKQSVCRLFANLGTEPCAASTHEEEGNVDDADLGKADRLGRDEEEITLVDQVDVSCIVELTLVRDYHAHRVHIHTISLEVT